MWTRTLAGEEIERRVATGSSIASAGLSSARNCVCAQDDLEPVLRAFAEGQNLELDGQRQSTIDLLGDFVLMTGVAGQDWAEAATTLASRIKPPLKTYIIAGTGAPDPEGR